jgi:hypothetical protein
MENTLIELMGSETTDAEAEAMSQILKERGLDVEEMSSEEFFALIPEAIERAKA